MSAFHTDGTNPLNSLPTAKKSRPVFGDYFSGPLMDPYGTSPNDPENVKRRVAYSKARSQYEADLNAFYRTNGPGYNTDFSTSRKLADDVMRKRYPEAPRNRGYNPSYGQTNSFTDEFGNVVNRDQAPPRDQDQAPPPPPGSYVKPYQPNGGVTFVGQSGNPSSTSGTLDMSRYGTSIRPQTDLRKLLKKR